MLDLLQQAGCPIGIVSNKMGPYLRSEVEALGWTGYFRRIVGAQDATNDKPHPACVGLVLEAVGRAADKAMCG